MTNLTLSPTKKATTCMMTHEQMQQMFSDESDDDEYLGFEVILLTLVRLTLGFDSLGIIGPKTRWVSYTSATYTRVYMVVISVSGFKMTVFKYNMWLIVFLF